MERAQIDYLLSVGILAKWHNKTFEQFTNDKDALQKVRKYLDNFDKFKSEGVGLFLYGANGTGKSHLLNCAFKELLDKRQRVRIISYSALISSFVGGWSNDENKKAVLQDFKRCDFLGIEEIGKEFRSKESELAVNVLDNVLRYRVQMNKPTWITTNLKPTQITAMYSEDISSLLKEACLPINVNADDFRDVQREKLKKLL